MITKSELIRIIEDGIEDKSELVILGGIEHIFLDSLFFKKSIDAAAEKIIELIRIEKK